MMPSIRGPHAEDHKYSRGTLHVVAGSDQYPGAAVLCAGAAVSTGVGMVTLHAPRRPADLVLARYPEVVAVEGQAAQYRLESASAVVLGPGLGEEEPRLAEAAEALRSAARRGVPCLVDASGLDLIPGRVPPGELGEHVVLTPHAGEAARLAQRLGDAGAEAALKEKDPAAGAKALAAATGCTVLLKGPKTAVAHPGGSSKTHRPNTPGLATAGTGDVLAGIIGALLATQDQPASVAALLGAKLHGAAAQTVDPLGMGRFGASHLLEAIRRAA